MNNNQKISNFINLTLSNVKVPYLVEFHNVGNVCVKDNYVLFLNDRLYKVILNFVM